MRRMRAGTRLIGVAALIVAAGLVAAPPSGPARSADASAGEAANTRNRTVVDATRYPWSAIGRVNVAVSQRGHCTGALIGERLVVTAAHCLFFRGTGKWVAPEYVHFLPGYQRDEVLAHSRAARYIAAPDFVGEDWNASTNLPHDWALIVLEEPLGREVGYLGWRAVSRGEGARALFGRSAFNLAGYPRDRAHAISLDSGCRLVDFLTVGSADLGLPPLVAHRCAIIGGDSGAPLALDAGTGSGLQVVALNSAADVRLSTGETINTAVPISTFLNEVRALLAETQADAPSAAATQASARPPR